MPGQRRAFRLNWYNGFSPEERLELHWALLDAMEVGRIPYPTGPCALCGQTRGPVVYHSEDYGTPYVFAPPAMYAICRSGHSLIHMRFRFPKSWEAFREHLRQGGACAAWARRRRRRQSSQLLEVRVSLSPCEGTRLLPLHGLIRDEWWEHLTLDPASLMARWARPRRGVLPRA